MTADCTTKQRLLDVVSQLADQGKQFTVDTFDAGWKVSYTSGPSRKALPVAEDQTA